MMNSMISFLAIITTSILFSCQGNETKDRGDTHLESTLPAAHKDVKRVGMVIKINPEKLEEYLALHADSESGVRDLLIKYNMRNFSIFMTQLADSSYYEFGYYEYWGDDFEADMKLLEAEPRNKAWLEVCDPMQIPLEGESSWREMKTIYTNY
jgi:L-rhamnose mutarotase